MMEIRIKIFMVVLLLVVKFNQSVQSKKLTTKEIEKAQKPSESSHKLTGCLCPATIERGYGYDYCGKKLTAKSGGKFNPEAIYDCVFPNIEAVPIRNCAPVKKCAQRTCNEDGDAGCKMPHSKQCLQ